MDLNDIVAEMTLSANPQTLIEWIYEEARDLDQVRTAIDAYFDAIEGQ